MSDDTPTQRLPRPDDDDGAPAGDVRRSRALLYVLLGVGAALLVAIVVLLIVLLTGDGSDPDAGPTPSTTPTATDTPSPTPTGTATPAPPAEPEPTQAPPPASVIVSYTASTTTANCPDTSSSVPITFNWNTTGSSVDFGIDTDVADEEPYQQDLPAVGGITVNYQCGNESTRFSIAVDFNGEVIARESIVVRR